MILERVNRVQPPSKISVVVFYDKIHSVLIYHESLLVQVLCGSGKLAVANYK